jgi:3-deoxy-D-manno-octulosonate 8-phosphate phosphatase (KDO 8-P phosphatase)
MNTLEQFQDVHTFIFDVDGVMTDSGILVLEDGKLLRKMSIRDGYALKYARQRGYRIAVISGGKSEGVRERLFGLGIDDLYFGTDHKIGAYEEFIELYDLDEAGILFMGDDLPDYEVMRRVGFPTCPADAAPEIRKISQYVSPRNGGEGCVRDIIEKVLRIRGDWVATDE